MSKISAGVIVLLLAGLAGCGDQTAAPKTEASGSAATSNASTTATEESEEQAAAPEQAAEPKHYYAMTENGEYGYEAGVSEDDQQGGQVAANLIMVKFAGEKDGKFQVFYRDSNVRSAYHVSECENPCRYMKSMTFLNGKHIKTERATNTEGSLGWAWMSDAINGEMERGTIESKKSGKSFVWFDEKAGMQTTPVASSSN